jgi:DNA-binding response OmpR family regulator
MSSAFANPVAELRHELRTPVNHIVGYAEMLLEDAEGEGLEARREALARTIAAAREVLSHIGAVLPATRSEIGDVELTSLLNTLREPQGRILGAMRELLLSVEATEDPAFQEDVKRIMNAAERLSNPIAGEKPDGTAGEEAVPVPAEDVAKARILVVDDVEDNREVLRRRLERQGYDVKCASDGAAALAMLRDAPFDLMLLDVLMPGLDGYETLERAKADPAISHVPVIMISALDDVSSVVRCIERGADDYLPKPFDPVLLKARVTSSLEKKRYLDRVARITEAASAVEDGTYRSAMLASIVDVDDPLGRLARVFDRMIQEVRAREERLRNRIRDLRMEIEEASSTGEFTAPEIEDASLQSGDFVGGRYEVRAVVGAGGMGSVYRARDHELEDDVALKMLLPALMTDRTLVERFKQEIRLARRITHPNVVRTHDLGEWEGIYFLTMEFVEGMTVRDLIDSRGQLGVSATMAIGTQLAEALAVAHAQGVVHRDIKPQNLLLDQEGVLKVMDFGVARLAERKSTLTEAGLVVGTPAYMAPEQLLAEAVDARSDLYAAGVVLYECLTGQLPFDADSPISLIAKLLHEEAEAPTTINRDIPPPLSELVLSLLAKKPDDRIQSASEMGRRLKEVE